MSIFNSSKSKKKKSSSDQKVKYFSDFSEEQNTSEKLVPAPASSSTNLSANITGTSQFGDMSVSEIGGIDPSGDFSQDLQELSTNPRRVNPEVIAQISEEDIEEENTSNLFINYNSEVDIKRIEQSKSIKELYDRLSLDHTVDVNENNILLLSHENYKITSTFENFFSGPRTFISNGTFINPEQLNILKSSYYKGKLNNISKRFFFNNKSEANYQELYINKIKTNNSKKAEYLDSFDEFTSISKEFTKNENFGNQLLEYSNSGKNKNYFGKISNIIYNKQPMITISNIDNHNNDSFTLVENISEQDNINNVLYENLDYVLKNYYKLESYDQVNNENNFFDNANIIDSDALITKILANCGTSFNNVSDGSFTNNDYKKETDLNFEIYNTLANEKSLKTISAISLVSDYDIIKDNNNRLNITSPFYTNTLSLSEIWSESNKIEFKNESKFFIKKNFYDNAEINFFNFKKSYGLQFKDVPFNEYNIIEGNNTEIFSMRNILMPWLTNNDMSNIDVNASTVQPNQDYPLRFREITDDEFKSNFGLSQQEYATYKNNLLEIDAFIHNNGDELSLVYFDANGVIRQTSSGDSNNIKYLSAPTFSFYTSHNLESGDGPVTNILDSSFNQALNSCSNSTLGGLKGRNINAGDTDLNIINFSSAGDNFYNFVKNDMLRYRPKKWKDLNLNRVSYAYSNNFTEHQNYNNHTYSNKLGYSFDRCWTIITEHAPSRRRINNSFFNNIGFGAIKYRFSGDYKLSSTTSINNISEIPTIKSKIYFPFICAINTNKTYDFNSSELKDKFLIREDNSKTSSEENFRERVVLSSTSRRYPNEVNNFVKEVKKESTSGKKQNDWIHRTFKIKRNLSQLKEILLKDTEFFKFLKSHTKKCNNIVKDKIDSNVYALIHDNHINSEKLYSLEESPFLIKKESTFYTKNNFLNINNDKVKLLNQNLSVFSQEEIREIKSFATISEYKEFMTAYFPKSFLKNSNTFFKKVNRDIAQSLDRYKESFFQENKKLLGFEKLLLNKIFSDFNVFKMFVYIIIEKEMLGNINSEDHKNSSSFFEVLNDKTNGLYNQYLTKLFSLSNIKEQETYTLRTIDDTALNSIAKKDLEGKTWNWNDAAKGKGFIGTTGGNIRSYLFPCSKHDSKRKASKLNFAVQASSSFRVASKYKQIAELLAVNTYNYDAYLQASEEQKNNNSLFTGISDGGLNIDINYIVLHKNIEDKIIGEKVNSDDINNYAKNSLNYTVRSLFTVPADQDNDGSAGDALYDRVPNSLFYEIHNTASYNYDMTIDLLNNDITFTNKLISYIKGFITYLYTDEEINNFITSDFINTNEKELKIMHKLVNEYVGSCLFAYKNIGKLSFYSNFYKEVQVERVNSNKLWWDYKIRDGFSKEYNSLKDNIYYDISKQEDVYSFRKNATGNPRLSKNFYSFKEFMDIRNINKLLEKSDYLETLNYDLVFAYLTNFDFNKREFISNNEEQLALSNNIESLSEEILSIENIDFSNVVSNDLKICKISKNMQSNEYYSRIKEENINRLNTSRLRNLDFNEYDIFDDKVKFEENKKALASVGLKYFMSGDNIASESFMKSDILRFGIPYNLANSLSNEKVLKISVYPVNHKYPELEFYPYEFLYTPILTSLTPASVNLIDQSSIDKFLGVYDINAIDFRKKYLFSNSYTPKIFTILSNIESRRKVFGFNTTLDVNLFNVEKIIKAAKFSNSVKYLNDSFNSIFDENKINRLDIDFDNIITGETLEMINSFNPSEFLKIFGENYEDAISYLTEETGYTSIVDKRKMVDNNIHSIEFFSNLNKDMSMTDFLKPLTTDAFFDIFSVRITRESLIQKIKNKEFLENFVSRNSGTIQDIVSSRQGFSNSYTYVITTEIY